MSATSPTPASDEELRQMRDAIYPATSEKTIQTDESWEQVKAAWRRDAEWLREQYEKLKR